MNDRRRTVLTALTGAIFLTLGAIAQDATTPPKAEEAPADPRVDVATGRQKATWPPDRVFDYEHIRLEVDIPDINKAALTGKATIGARVLGIPTGRMVLNCEGPEVTSVEMGGNGAKFHQEDGKLIIDLGGMAKPGQEVQATIGYTLDFSKASGEGLTWAGPTEDATSDTNRFPMIHAQGQAELNHRWFPCFDHPSDRLTSEVIVTVADGFEVLSNGRLVTKREAGDGRVRWHWTQEQPHAAYLITLLIGKFSVVELGGPESARPGISFPVYAPIGSEDEVREAYGDTPAMVRCFEEYFDEPYPWHQLAQGFARKFSAGGMENTGAILYGIRAAQGERGSKDDLSSHEIAHMWFGDLVTCRSWDHIWLNEGWATFSEGLWAEWDAKRRGEDGRAAYLDFVRKTLRGQGRRNRGSAPQRVAMVSNRFTNPDAVFGKSDDPYGKGAMVLHMLREMLGEEVFWKGARLYLDRFRLKEVETNDFRRVMEEVSGRDLERFFEQWTMRPGLARLTPVATWEGGTVKIEVSQTQKIDRFNPAYVFDLPLMAHMSDGSTRLLTLACDARTNSATYTLDGTPTKIEIDPTMSVAAVIRPNVLTPQDKPEAGTDEEPGAGTESQ